MIRGTVNARNEASVPLRLRGPQGAEIDIEAVIDTGFSAFLTLSSDVVDALDLAAHSAASATLGDGSTRQYYRYSVEVLWDGSWLRAVASAIGNDAMIGMRLLAGYKLCVDVTPGGAVEIGAIP